MPEFSHLREAQSTLSLYSIQHRIAYTGDEYSYEEDEPLFVSYSENEGTNDNSLPVSEHVTNDSR